VGWLYGGTRYRAVTLFRDEGRRRVRERQVMGHVNAACETSPDWDRVRPCLDEAMANLSDPDREALLLRFFKNQDLRAVGAALGVSDDAAQKRVTRSLEKLHADLLRRGVTTTAVALSTVVSVHAVQIAPAGLAATLTTASLAGAAAGTGTALTLLKFMATTKSQLVIVGAVVMASVVTPLLVQHQAQARMRDQDEALRQQTDQLTRLQAENERLSSLLAGAKSPRSFSNDPLSELLRLRGEVGRLAKDVQELAQSKTISPMSRADVLASREKLWLARANQLKQWLEEHPSEKIPELQFLDDPTWIAAVYPHTLENEDEYRRAMRLARANGEDRFHSMMFRALRQYAKENAGQFPTDLAQLKPYFKSPIDDAILQRYEILPASHLVNELQPGGDWVITQKAPVNNELDIRVAIGLTNILTADERVTNRWVLVP